MEPIITTLDLQVDSPNNRDLDPQDVNYHPELPEEYRDVPWTPGAGVRSLKYSDLVSRCLVCDVW